MIPQETVLALTRHIRDAVRPYLGTRQARAISGTAASGDATFAIDDIAENAIVSFIEREQLAVAYYSEDKGLVEFGTAPEAVLIIDPIDGTRPAAAGFEACVVSVAWADYVPTPTMADVRFGCIAEIKGSDVFLAERGKGTLWLDARGEPCPICLLPITQIALAPLTFEVVARPLEWLTPVLGPIVDAAAMRGGCFVFNSTAYSLTRLLTGQLAAVLDVGNRVYQEKPHSHARFHEVGMGRPIGIFTYDIAAAALIASEAGAVVTDAFGRNFAGTPLLDTSSANVQSLVAATTPELHAALLTAIGDGMGTLPA